MKSKWLFTLCMVLSAVLVLGACAPTPAARADKPVRLVIATAGATSTWYAVGTGVASVLTRHEGMDVSVEVAGGAVANMRAVGRGDAELGFSTSTVANDAYHGNGMEANPDVRMILSYGLSPIHIFTLADSGIQSLADMRGRRVSVGAAGSSAALDAEKILRGAGINPDADIRKFHFTQDEAGAALKDGQIDAIFVAMAIPSAMLSEIAATHRIRMIPVDDPVRAQILKNSGYQEFVITNNIYGAGDAATIGTANTIVVNAKVPDDVVYRITKAIFAYRAEVAEAHPTGRGIAHDKALSTSRPLPLHPGAERYYREVGVLK